MTPLKPASFPLSSPTNAVALLYMLTGKLLYRRANRTYFLESGDTLLFDTVSPHGLEKLSEAPASYLSIVISPRETKRPSDTNEQV